MQFLGQLKIIRIMEVSFISRFVLTENKHRTFKNKCKKYFRLPIFHLG